MAVELLARIYLSCIIVMIIILNPHNIMSYDLNTGRYMQYSNSPEVCITVLLSGA